MRFEGIPQPEQSQENNQEFTGERGLSSILSRLVEMQARGEVVHGSSHDYTPKEIAFQIREVIEELEPQVRRSNCRTIEEMKSGAFEPNLDSVSKLNSLTRSMGLRSAVRQALEYHLKEPMGYRANIRLDEEFLTIFRQVAKEPF